MSRFYLTTPIYYVNDVPHIGTSYTTIAADILARYHRARGEEVLFATGTDENATKVVEAAERAGKQPLEFVDGMAENFKRAWSELHIDYDVFIRTTEERHKKAVQTLFRTLQENGDIYQGPYEGWYCVNCETFFSPDEAPEVDGVRACPNVPQHPPLRLVQETNYFFALSKYGDRLLAHIEANPDFLQPEFRRNEVIAFIQQGLRDVCITRSATGWGIPVPDDPSQVVYVWFDALINYLTIAGYPDDTAALEKWWPADLHLVGKDIYVRFHCTLWPAMLMAAGLTPPKSVFGHGFWMSEGIRMSKSLGNFIEPLKLARWLAELSGAQPEIAVDAMRYFLFREMPFGEDGNFARHSLLQRFNSDLANDLGNVLNRTLSIIRQNFGEEVPASTIKEMRLVGDVVDTHNAVSDALDRYDLQAALAAIWDFVSATNKYLDERAPWRLAKEGKLDELASVMEQVKEAIRCVSVWISPFMPNVSAEIRRQLSLAPGALKWQEACGGTCGASFKIREPAPIFPRIDKKVMSQALSEVQSPTPAAEPQPAPAAVASAAPAAEEEVSNIITIDDFVKVQLRVAEVLSCERVPKSDKLLNCRVSLGTEERTVLAGMAEYYEPEALVGRKVIMVANLAPRKMRGLESQGMLLAAESDGKVSLLQPDQDLPAGSTIR